MVLSNLKPLALPAGALIPKGATHKKVARGGTRRALIMRSTLMESLEERLNELEAGRGHSTERRSIGPSERRWCICWCSASLAPASSRWSAASSRVASPRSTEDAHIVAAAEFKYKQSHVRTGGGSLDRQGVRRAHDSEQGPQSASLVTR